MPVSCRLQQRNFGSDYTKISYRLPYSASVICCGHLRNPRPVITGISLSVKSFFCPGVMQHIVVVRHSAMLYNICVLAILCFRTLPCSTYADPHMSQQAYKCQDGGIRVKIRVK